MAVTEATESSDGMNETEWRDGPKWLMDIGVAEGWREEWQWWERLRAGFEELGVELTPALNDAGEVVFVRAEQDGRWIVGASERVTPGEKPVFEAVERLAQKLSAMKALVEL